MNLEGIVLPLSIIILGIVFGPWIWYFTHTVEERSKNRVRNLYAELVKEKLDVIRTAIAMGHNDDEISRLDARLEKLIGTEKMLDTLKSGRAAVKDIVELRDADLLDELKVQSAQRKADRE